jgi:hypothetical protein
VSSAVNQTTGAVNQAAAPATQQPLVQPDLGALTQQPASAAAPATLGGAVQNATNTLGTTVGGTAGQAVKDTGAAVGDTVDKVTTGLTNAAGQLLGGGAGQ